MTINIQKAVEYLERERIMLELRNKHFEEQWWINPKQSFEDWIIDKGLDTRAN